MLRRSLLLALCLFICFSASLPALDSIRLEPPLVDPDTPENRRRVTDFLERVQTFAGRRYGDHFTFGATGDYSLRFVMTLESGPVGSLVMKKDGREVSMPFFGLPEAENVPYAAALVAALWNSFSGGLAGMDAPAPELIDVLPAERALSSVPGLLPALTQSLAPMGGAVDNRGNLLVAFGSLAVVLDSHLGVVSFIGKDLLDAGNYTGAGGVFVTPAGTVFLKPSSGRTALKYPPGGAAPKKVPLGMDPYGSFTVLNDGRIVAGDIMTRKIFLIEDRNRVPLKLSAGANSYISFLGTGPEGNIWSWDMVERRFKIHTPEDVLIGSVVPVAGPALHDSPTSFSVCPDGGFIMAGTGAGGPVIVRYGADGVPRWRLDELALPFSEALPMNAVPVFDPSHGYIYLLDMTGRRIIRFLDRAWTDERGIDTKEADPLIDVARALREYPDDIELYRRAVEVYLLQGAVEPAIAALSSLLGLDPYNREARERKNTLEAEVLRNQAAVEKARTLDLLESFGPSTAQSAYMGTLQIYEKILNLYPEDEDTRLEMEDLKNRFDSGGRTTPPNASRIEIVAADLENLFPSLMLYYRGNPAGTVVLKNTGTEAVEDPEVSVFINRYMDYPSVLRPAAAIAPGQSLELEVTFPLNEKVLSLQEDLPVQSLVKVSWQTASGTASVSEAKPLTIYRNTSLSWDYSGKLASFITPNEGVVSRFAHRVLSGTLSDREGFPKNLVHGALICDALGAYGIDYIEDPDSPFSEALGKSEVLDTVRFPRTTLYTRTGDCDDTTALLASLLEASGIATAIMTSPGHVFLAFDSGEPVENRRLFVPEGYEGIRHDGRVWIPVETTTLTKGFLFSWKTASETLRNYPNAVEFLPVAAERDTYPPLPLPESALLVVEPQGTEVQRLFGGSMEGMLNLVYRAGTEELEHALAAAEGRDNLRARNRLGALHARFGNIEAARDLFMENIEEDPDYLPSYLNLANLHVGEGELASAGKVLLAGLTIKPDSGPLNLLLSRVYEAEGKNSMAGEYFARLEAADPELAERFAALEEPGDGVSRAGIEEDGGMLIWDVEE